MPSQARKDAATSPATAGGSGTNCPLTTRLSQTAAAPSSRYAAMVARAWGSRTVLGFGSRRGPGSPLIIRSTVMVGAGGPAQANGVSQRPAPPGQRARAAAHGEPEL